jgi:2-polyprenyl-6-hydroxyphenyl methylase/3-demethylubiquinone-9 3-methyltransferase
MSSTIDAKEIEKFSKIADEWWSETGKFKPLHKFNPIRISFIKEKIIEHFALEKNLENPLSKITILDIGCGGGLISEPFAKLGADLTAIDASPKNIEIAKIHAAKSNLKINYLATSPEEISQENQKFDVVFALEIVEHVADLQKFIESCAKLVKPNGLVFIATINRTLKSLALAKIAVEYVLRWLPRGTHDWQKFLKPSEINFHAINNQLELQNLIGFSYNIFNDQWSQTNNLDVNYAAVFLAKN